MRIEELRLERGLTEVELAKLANSNRRTLQAIKKNGDCKASTAIKYAVALGVSLDYLFADEMQSEKKRRGKV